MRYVTFGILLIVAMSVVGCSNGKNAFKPDTFSSDDMCIVKVNDESAKVCYGDSKETAEKILGKGKNGEFGNTEYDFGVSIEYRQESVVSILITDGAYRTARGAEIGMSKEEVKKMYGEKYAIDSAKYNLDYFYDTTKKRFLGNEDLDVKVGDESEKTYVLSMTFDDAGIAHIMMLDHKWAKTFS